MLKKEFRDTLRILLESSSLLLSVPLIILTTLIMGLKINVVQLIKMISIVTVFAFSGYSGLGMFLWEKRDKGFEYLLTLPISRLKLFIYKLVPRFVATETDGPSWTANVFISRMGMLLPINSP